jgi:hypothetical protein
MNSISNKAAFTLSKSSRSVGFKVTLFSIIVVFSQLKRIGKEMKLNIKIQDNSSFPASHVTCWCHPIKSNDIYMPMQLTKHGNKKMNPL